MFPPKKKSIGGMIGQADQSPPKYKSAPDKPPEAPPAPAEPPPPEPKAAPGAGDYGDKLLSDAIAPLVALGLTEDEAKTVLAGIFVAMAKCLGGDSEPQAAPEPSGDDTSGGMPA